MGELYELFPKLPKNIRQIGERDPGFKAVCRGLCQYIFKAVRPAKGADLRVGLLLGNREIHEDVPYVFVDGALEMETVAKDGEKAVFTEDAWQKAYQEVENRFPKRTVQGWFLCGNPGCSLNPLNYWQEHSHYFTGKNQLMYLNSGLRVRKRSILRPQTDFINSGAIVFTMSLQSDDAGLYDFPKGYFQSGNRGK